jgi:hypothetical protein
MKKTFIIIGVALTNFICAQLYVPGGTIGGPTSNPSTSNVGIGTNNPAEKFTVSGGHAGSLILLHSSGDDANQPANLAFWASEPLETYTGVGIGNNIKNYNGSQAFTLINPSAGGSYMRLLDNQMNFNLVSNSGNKQEVLTIIGNGYVGIGENNPTEKLDISGNSRINGNYLNIEQSYGNNTEIFLNQIGKIKWNLTNQAESGNLLIGNGDGTKFLISPAGNVSLQGKLEAKELKVTLTPTADFVFDQDYDLPKLEDVEKHIKEKKHLPEVASAEEMEKKGVNVGEFQIKLLQKIEELTLYTIEQNKQLKKQAEEIEILKNQINNKK